MGLTELQQQLNEKKKQRSALKRYLASHQAQLDPDYKEIKEAAFTKIKKEIAELYRLIVSEKAKIVTVMGTTTRTTYKASKQEQEAIMHFNSNNKYKITE